MKKSVLSVFLVGLFVICATGMAGAVSTTLVAEKSEWRYSVLSTDLWTNWGAAGYGSFDWGHATWSTGNAAFGNPYSLPYNTAWAANTDLALQKTFTIDGALSTPITLNVASDNGFMVFINGNQVAKENAEGYTFYWEYTLGLSASPFLSPGLNLIQVLAEDHGGATFFDLKLTGDVSPVPEPSTLVLFAMGIAGLASGLIRRKK